MTFFNSLVIKYRHSIKIFIFHDHSGKRLESIPSTQLASINFPSLEIDPFPWGKPFFKDPVYAICPFP
jgi:hypothetical protein